MTASREHSQWAYRRRFWAAAAVALAVHASVYFTSRPAEFIAARFGHDDPAATVEVDLVEQAQEPAPEELPTPEPTPPESTPPESPEPPTPPEPDALSPIEPPPPPKPAAPPKPQSPRTSSPPPKTVKAGSPTAAPQPGNAGAATGGITSKATASYSPLPLYPAESRAAKEQGTVILQGAVDATGRITRVTVKKSSGFPRLDRAAEEAFRRHKLRPAMRNGQPTEDLVEKAFRFKVE